jgi:hypothetical protein
VFISEMKKRSPGQCRDFFHFIKEAGQRSADI